MTRKNILLIGILGFILVFCVLAIIFSTGTKRGNLEISTSPTKTTVKINDKSYKVNKTLILNLEPGEYTAEISADNFSSETLKFTIKVKDKLSSYGVLLYPTNKDGENLLAEKKEQEWRDIVGQLNAVNQNDRLFDENPLFSYLPYSEADFRVDYGIEGEGFVVWITADSAAATNKAREWIKSVDSKQTYNIKTRKYSESPLQVNRSESWEPIGRDVSADEESIGDGGAPIGN